MGKAKRIILGLAAVVAVAVVGKLLAAAGGEPSGFFTSSGLGTFLAFVAGGYVARSGFLVPALLVNSAMWSITVVAAGRLAAAAEGTRFMAVVADNLGGLTLYTIAAAAGAALGMWLYSLRSSLWLLDH